MKKIIFLGCISFILAAAWLMPLAFIAPYINKITNQIYFKDPNGTIWNGGANQLIINNYNLGKASWKVDPIQSLKSLSLKSKFTINGNDINAFGVAGISASQQLTIDNTQFDINARLVNSLQSNAQLTGTFNGFIKSALLIKAIVPEVDAIVNWQNGAINSPIKLAEGDYRAVITPQAEFLEVKLSSKEAPIELNGDIKLQNDWIFATNLVAKSNNPGLMAILKFAGKPQADGAILIKQTGDLKPFVGIN